MKKNLALILVVFCITAKAQITLEHTFNVYNLEIVNFSNTNVGEKFFSNTEQLNFYSHQDTVTVYNADYSIYKVIPVPVNFIYADFYTFDGTNTPSLSDELFNTDTSFEYIAAQATNGGGNLYSAVNESGQVIFTFPDTLYSGIYISKIGNDFKVASRIGGSNSNTPYKIYSLPGSLPCNQCNSFVAGIVEPSGTHAKMGFEAYPNPFNGTLNINYNLPAQQDAKITLTDMLGREMMSIPTTKQSDNLSVSTSGLPSGMIVVTLAAANGQMISKKVVKIQ